MNTAAIYRPCCLLPASPPPVRIKMRESIRTWYPSPFIPDKLGCRCRKSNFRISVCLPPPQSSSTSGIRFNPSTKLYISGLSFRTTDDSLRNAFKNFGELVEVNLVMDKIANRPRGFAFIRYATDEESKKAIEGMHGKFLDGRVIFVEVAKSRAELRRKLVQERAHNRLQN